MLMDIFSAFDPGTNLIFSSSISPMFWIFSLTSASILYSTLWVTPTRFILSLYLPIEIMAEQASRTNSKHLPTLHAILVPLFFFIIIMNLSGLVPYVFSLTSHLIFTLTFGLPLWLALIISSLEHAPLSFAAALLPGGAPAWLNPPLVLIETLSALVRPITLSFRLAANMTAGHIIMTLLGIYLMVATLNLNFTSMLILLPLQTFYTVFEFGISLIQAYIFCLLLSLYSDDHPLH
uniref:ATP synthase subunit a n=1 Tax=Sipunculus nudus TaxID=6446 RepID=A0A0U1WZH7_SIPNU|nr:ATP synthase F0 subunit 6 [Sipunculus nudus]AWK60887.1 ATP synthase F0 subunit 6 [Sipunculus nudus]